MENRFRSAGIGESKIVYMHEYPNRWTLVKHNREYRHLRYYESISGLGKVVISNESVPDFGNLNFGLSSCQYPRLMPNCDLIATISSMLSPGICRGHMNIVGYDFIQTLKCKREFQSLQFSISIFSFFLAGFFGPLWRIFELL